MTTDFLEQGGILVPSDTRLTLLERLSRAIVGLEQRVRRNAFGATIALLLFLLTIAFFWRSVVVTIPAGHQAVIWRRLSGTDLTTIYGEGTQLVLPWNVIQVYDLRAQKADNTVKVLSQDGLEIRVNVTVRYHPEAKTLPYLHKEVGPFYRDTVVMPEVVAAVRGIMGRYRPQELFTQRTEEMEALIVATAARQVRRKYVSVDNILIGEIILPDAVQAAIQMKLKQEQEAQEYEFRLIKEQKEALRKVTEGDGIRRYQEAVREGLPESILRWKGIEATLELAKSNNAKVIVIGGRDGLPLILDGVVTPGRGATDTPLVGRH
jgi:regulator of protease activity HflC (stomatin/prohibitin superfamily)